MKLTSPGAFLRTLHHEFFNRLAMEYINFVRCDGGVLISDFREMVCQWFPIGIFRVLRRMHCTRILALLVIARLAEIDWDAISVEWFPLE